MPQQPREGLPSLQADPSPLPLVSQTKQLREAWPAKPGRIPVIFTFHTRAVCLVIPEIPLLRDKSGNGFGKYQFKALAS